MCWVQDFSKPSTTSFLGSVSPMILFRIIFQQFREVGQHFVFEVRFFCCGFNIKVMIRFEEEIIWSTFTWLRTRLCTLCCFFGVVSRRLRIFFGACNSGLDDMLCGQRLSAGLCYFQYIVMKWKMLLTLLHFLVSLETGLMASAITSPFFPTSTLEFNCEARILTSADLSCCPHVDWIVVVEKPAREAIFILLNMSQHQKIICVLSLVVPRWQDPLQCCRSARTLFHPLRPNLYLLRSCVTNNTTVFYCKAISIF